MYHVVSCTRARPLVRGSIHLVFATRFRRKGVEHRTHDTAWMHATKRLQRVPRCSSGGVDVIARLQRRLHAPRDEHRERRGTICRTADPVELVCKTPQARFGKRVEALPLVLGVPIPGFAGFGFAACPWVTVGVELGQGLGLWAYAVPAKRLHERCWPGWSLSHVTLSRVRVCAEPALRAAQRNGRSRGVRNSQKPTYTHADPDARVPTHLRPRRALHRERFLEDVSSRRPRR